MSDFYTSMIADTGSPGTVPDQLNYPYWITLDTIEFIRL